MALLTARYASAVDYAREAHEGDVRKGTRVPYLAHVLAVSAIVLEHDGDEDQAIAALLHDTAEDAGGEARLAHIATTFGDRVAELVRHCSDSLTADPTQKAPWWERKVAYLDHARRAPVEALVISAADKVHNAEALDADYRRHGEELWSRFNPDAGRPGQLWYQEQVALVLGDRLAPHHPALADRLQVTVDRLVTAVAAVVGPAQVATDREAAQILELDTRRRLSPDRR